MPKPSADPTPLTEKVWADLKARMDAPPSADGLAAMLRYLAKWRSELLANTLVQLSGATVQHGPFKGMRFPVRAAEGGRPPRLLGSYEGALWEVMEMIIDNGYGLIVDIGAAEGYYAVGLARAIPDARVLARDTDPNARMLCAALAAENGVASRVEIGGLFTHDDFAICAKQDCLVICDIEGAEAELLDPALAPALRQADILVEVHEGTQPGLLQTLTKRFAKSHRITRYDRKIMADTLPDWASGFGDLDRLLMLWEWRAQPTPWLWMERR